MEINENIAELAGAFAADGSMRKAHLCMWGNISEDREYYDQVICPLIDKEFGIIPRVHPKGLSIIKIGKIY